MIKKCYYISNQPLAPNQAAFGGQHDIEAQHLRTLRLPHKKPICSNIQRSIKSWLFCAAIVPLVVELCWSAVLLMERGMPMGRA